MTDVVRTSWPNRTIRPVLMAPSRLRTPSEIASVRITSWRHSHRKPSAASLRQGRRSTISAPAAGGRGVTTIAKTSAADTANVAASKNIGRAKPTSSSTLASGGPMNWLATNSAEYIRPLARSSSGFSTIAGMNV